MALSTRLALSAAPAEDNQAERCGPGTRRDFWMAKRWRTRSSSVKTEMTERQHQTNCKWAASFRRFAFPCVCSSSKCGYVFRRSPASGWFSALNRGIKVFIDTCMHTSITFLCITLHFIALHYTTLHYTTSHTSHTSHTPHTPHISHTTHTSHTSYITYITYNILHVLHTLDTLHIV